MDFGPIGQAIRSYFAATDAPELIRGRSMMMEADRLSAWKIAPDAMRAVMNVQTYIAQSGLDKKLIELVKMRASQINGCAYCLDAHSKEARRIGESEQRLYLLNAWAESSLYTPRERAALAWTEAVTRIADTHAPDAVYEALKPHFSEKEIVDLTTLIGLINILNRLAIGFRYRHATDGTKAA
jgi:AhpD family alkylhydroperoxidase